MTLTVLVFIPEATSLFHENWLFARTVEKSIISPLGSYIFSLSLSPELWTPTPVITEMAAPLP